MSQNFNQRNTLIKLTTALGDNATQFKSMSGGESISELYNFKILFSATANSVDPQKLIGKPVSVTLAIPNNEQRFFHGILISLRNIYHSSGISFEGHIMPQLALLQYRSNCRIFQNKSIVDIAEAIFKEHNLKNYELSITRGNYKPLEYCVQYRESDFDFISRLLEQAGIYYFFKHAKDKHTLVLADSTRVYQTTNLTARLSSNHLAGISDWQCDFNFISGKWSYTDHDFINPNKKLLSATDTIHTNANSKTYEIYDYPGDYLTTDAGNQLTKIRMEQVENAYCIAQGSSDYSKLTLAGKFKLDNKTFPQENGNSYVVTNLQHDICDIAQLNEYSHSIYRNHFSCIPAETIIRPTLTHKKPAAPGVQLGTIVGPSGQEIHTDKYGRMKAQFMWDRLGKTNETSSCWMRAVQQWDGLLRIGTPVLIGFIDDDIDKPIILGPVYNTNLMPIPKLNDSQSQSPTQSVLKRRNVKNSDEKKYNELRFEDKADNEMLSLYASKDMSAVIEQDFKQQVKKGNYTLIVKGDITIQAEGNIIMGSKKSITLNADESINLNAKQNINFAANQNIKSTAKQNIQADASMEMKNSAGTKLTNKALEINNQATTKLSNKALEINNQADVRIASKAALHNVEADGLLILKGGLVKEN